METINSTPQAVTIAGSDSGGGAGMQADLKTFQARHVFGMSIVVALTAQNTLGVQASMPVPPGFIDAQFTSLAADFKIRAAKTGMLADELHVRTVAYNLKQVDFGPLVVDPVMIAKGGHALLDPGAITVLKDELLPLATVVTPNLPEAEALVGFAIKTDLERLQAAKLLQERGTKNVIIKGGHQSRIFSEDFVLLENGETLLLRAPRIETQRTHGTGDTFSACIAAELAKGAELKEAITTAKAFIQGAIAQGIEVGHGHGPTNHWAALSKEIEIAEEH